MRYDAVRDLITTGDVIMVKNSGGFLSPFTRFFTHSEYTHTGIAIWFNNGLWMAELNGGRNHLIPLSQLRNMHFDVYHCPVDNRYRVEEAITDNLRDQIEYGYVALPVIGLLNFLRVKLFLHARRLLVCSGYVVKILEQAGWAEHTRILSPAELANELEFFVSVKPE